MNRQDPAIQVTVNRLAWMEEERRDFASWMQGRENVFQDIFTDALHRMDAAMEEERETLDALKGYA